MNPKIVVTNYTNKLNFRTTLTKKSRKDHNCLRLAPYLLCIYISRSTAADATNNMLISFTGQCVCQSRPWCSVRTWIWQMVYPNTWIWYPVKNSLPLWLKTSITDQSYSHLFNKMRTTTAI